MKKQLTYLENKIERLKKENENNKKMKAKLDSLSLVERNAYEQIMLRQDNYSIFFDLIIFPLKFLFYAGLIGLIAKYALGIDILLQIRIIIGTIWGLWGNLFIAWILIVIVYNFFIYMNKKRTKEKILLNL